MLVASLEIAHANNEEDTEPTIEEVVEDSDICVGCDKEEEPAPEQLPQLTVEIRIDPVTGAVQYVIRGITLE